MEIKEAISLYDFLGKIGYWGSSVLAVILIAVISYLISNATEKLTDDSSGDKSGIELIDTSATRMIEKYYDEMLPFYRAKILNYMAYQQLDSISYPDVLYIDERLQYYIIDKLIARYVNDFTPISIYDNYYKWNWYGLKNKKGQMNCIE